jgi:hypothetical protein
MSSQTRPSGEEVRKVNAQQVQQTVNEVTATAEMLRTESDRIGLLARFWGFGRRILVPADEIHAVVGDGIHSTAISHETKIFGKNAGQSSFYWLNPLTQVIKLKTISFTVPIRGEDGSGVDALDLNKVSFRLWAHAVAKLNPAKAEVAAQRVGVDTTSLLNTITKVGSAELVAAGATMELHEIIASRQRLAEIAFPKVNQILAELGYDLALLTITELGGEAYGKLVTQAESRISKETSIATNREQIAEIQDGQGRERTEAEIRAATEKKLAAERLDAERTVEEATLSQQEVLAVRRHEVELRSVERRTAAAEANHSVELTQVQLARKLSEVETLKDAELAQLRSEREAELRALQQQRQATLRLAETEAKANELAMEQVREIERQAERTQAEAERLRNEELARAERAKEVALLKAAQESEALQIKATAETNADLVRAEGESTAVEKRAQAAKIRAEATRAESAAQGLAEAEVEAARIQVAEKQVAVTRAEGLAQAEIAKAQADAEANRLQRIKEVEITAQRQLVQLYTEAPVLVDLEIMKMKMSHEERLTQIQMDAYLKAFEAIAPNVRIQIVGNGGQVGRVLGEVLTVFHGTQILGEEIPALGRLLNGSEHDSEGASTGGFAWGSLRPALQQVIAGIEPRILAGMNVADLVEEAGKVFSGEVELTEALENLRADTSFRVLGNLPVIPLLRSLGLLVGMGNPPEPVQTIERSEGTAALTG